MQQDIIGGFMKKFHNTFTHELESLNYGRNGLNGFHNPFVEWEEEPGNLETGLSKIATTQYPLMRINNPKKYTQNTEEMDIQEHPLQTEFPLLKLTRTKANPENSQQDEALVLTNPIRKDNKQFFDEMNMLENDSESQTNKSEDSSVNFGKVTLYKPKNEIKLPKQNNEEMEDKIIGMTERALNENTNFFKNELNKKEVELKKYIKALIHHKFKKETVNMQEQLANSATSLVKFGSMSLDDPNILQPKKEAPVNPDYQSQNDQILNKFLSEIKHSLLPGQQLNSNNAFESRPLTDKDMDNINYHELRQSNQELKMKPQQAEDIIGDQPIRNYNQTTQILENQNDLLAFLAPNKLSKYNRNFKAVEDIFHIEEGNLCPALPQRERLDYQDQLKRDKQEIERILQEEDEKTKKALLDIMDRNLKSLEEQADDIEKEFDKTDMKFNELKEFMKDKEREEIIRDMLYRAKQIERKRLEAEYASEEDVELQQIMIDNRLLLDECEDVVGQYNQGDISQEELNQSLSTLNDSLIDNLLRSSIQSKSIVKEAPNRNKRTIHIKQQPVAYEKKKKNTAELQKEKRINQRIMNAFQDLSKIIGQNREFHVKNH